MKALFPLVLACLLPLSPITASVTRGDWTGETGYWIKGEQIEAFVTAEKRMRILALRKPGQANLLANTGATFDGIRLWIMTPHEEMATRDEVASLPGTATPVNAHTVVTESLPSPNLNLQATWRVGIDPLKPVLHLDFQLTNRGESARDIALWSLIGLVPPAEILLPLHHAGSRPANPRPIYHFPWSDMNDPRLRVHEDYLSLSIRPGDGSGSIKVGVFHPEGMAAARVKDSLLVSQVPVEPNLPYPEGGPNLTAFASPANGKSPFGELEHMGPVHQLDPGETVSLRQVLRIGDPDADSFLDSIGFTSD